MITPRFSCTQTAQSVIIDLYCPSVRASDVEINVDDTLVTVHINPYFLRLNFSNSLTEDEESLAQYDPGTGHLTVTLTKQSPGQEFHDLDLLAKLLAPRPTAVYHPEIEVISSEDNAEDDLVSKTQALSLEQEDILQALENDWQLPQKVPEPLPSLIPRTKYGFLNLHSGYFTNVTYTDNEVNELGGEAEICSPEERRQKRLAHEEKKWDEEHYLADYVDDEYIQELLSWRHPHANTDPVEYTEKENLAMLNLPRREYMSTSVETRQLYLTLITLLFSYAYESRASQHDPTPESAWTICSLTSAFSALDPPPYFLESSQNLDFSEDQVILTLVPSYRRSLAFPLYRSFAFADACRKDVASFFGKGKRTIFRCLLEMKDMLDHHEVYYVYSKIWLDDFCVWIQACASDAILLQLSERLGSLEFKKSLIGWDLEHLESAAGSSPNRDTDSDDDSDAA
ncbi:SHQ1 protein-domain-containing protein [Mycena floridula]|nr:SHQ1 protein-domain-containing protein [Mycena floridula]